MATARPATPKTNRETGLRNIGDHTTLRVMLMLFALIGVASAQFPTTPIADQSATHSATVTTVIANASATAAVAAVSAEGNADVISTANPATTIILAVNSGTNRSSSSSSSDNSSSNLNGLRNLTICTCNYDDSNFEYADEGDTLYCPVGYQFKVINAYLYDSGSCLPRALPIMPVIKYITNDIQLLCTDSRCAVTPQTLLELLNAQSSFVNNVACLTADLFWKCALPLTPMSYTFQTQTTNNYGFTYFFYVITLVLSSSCILIGALFTLRRFLTLRRHNQMLVARMRRNHGYVPPPRANTGSDGGGGGGGVGFSDSPNALVTHQSQPLDGVWTTSAYPPPSYDHIYESSLPINPPPTYISSLYTNKPLTNGQKVESVVLYRYGEPQRPLQQNHSLQQAPSLPRNGDHITSVSNPLYEAALLGGHHSPALEQQQQQHQQQQQQRLRRRSNTDAASTVSALFAIKLDEDTAGQELPPDSSTQTSTTTTITSGSEQSPTVRFENIQVQLDDGGAVPIDDIKVEVASPTSPLATNKAQTTSSSCVLN